MRSIAVVACAVGLLSAARPLHTQQNPFKVPRSKIPAMQVTYAYTGDLAGTGARSFAGERMAEHQTTTGKFFGKKSTHDTWTLTTPDSVFTADLVRRTGTRMPNMLPAMARAYDGLGGTDKRRLHQNMQDMSEMIGAAFGVDALSSGEKGETRTYAGETCDERTFGTFSVCSMHGAPAVPLHVTGSMLCVNFEQTATAVQRATPPDSAFDPPPGIVFRPSISGDADSLARSYVGYLASQELTDSIAKAKADLQAERARSNASAPAGSHEMTPEERAQAKQACEALKNFDLGKALADAGHRVVGDAVKEGLQETQNSAEQKAKSKIKGLFHRP
jgi:hypothetical protein